jgi:hypothetical protein
MGLKRAHTQRVGQGQGLTVGGFGPRGLRGMAVRVDLAEEPQGPGLLTLLGIRAAELQATHRDCQRLVEAAEAQIRLTQPDTDPGPRDLHGLRRDTLLQQRQGFRHPSRQDIRIAQGRGDDVKQERDVPDPTDVQAAFEPRDRLVPCAFVEVDMADTIAGLDQAIGVIDGLGNPEAFFCMARAA